MRPENYIIKYLDEVPLMQLATCSDNQPWVVSVYFAMDNLHNLYWVSQNDRRHSLNLVKNTKAAATIHQPYAIGQPARAVQVEGDARAVSSEQIESQFQAYAEKFTKHTMLPLLLDTGSPHTLYQLTPRRFVLWDELNFPGAPRQEWNPAVAPDNTEQAGA